MTSTVGRLVVDVLTNQSGGAVALGDVVYVDTGHDSAFTTGTTSAYIGMVGVCIEANGIANAASGRIQLAGHCAQVNLNASGTRGHFIKTFTVAKQATDAGASRITGAFGQILVTGTTPPVELFGFPDGSTGSAGSGGTPALTLSTTNSAGVAVTLVATDATIAAFDGTVPVTQAFADAAATGSAGVAARRDHKHGMPAAGVTFSTLGTTSIGASFTTTAATIYLKKITMASAGLITGIIAGIKGDAANGSGLTAAIMSDNSGVPLRVIAVGPPIQRASDNTLLANLGISATARSITVPVVYYAAAADYWLCVLPFAAGTSRILLAFSSGTGADYSQVANQFSDQSFIAATTTTNDYSIACNVQR